MYSVRTLLIVAISLRCLLIFTMPNLSDDIYRFIWDGRLLTMGLNPYDFLPSEFILNNTDAYFQFLYANLNSPDYFSVYPPFSQFVFLIGNLFKPTEPWISSFIIKSLLCIAEIITIFFALKLLKNLKLPTRNILWYALNPLVIVEIMGNCHFEGFMVCFFVLFLYFLQLNQINKSALFISLSIASKLLPLLFLPYLIFQWNWKKSFPYIMKIGVLLLIFFLPIIYKFSEFGASIDLYFRKFEFNGSIYYLLRAIGQFIYGYNKIAFIGPFLGITTFFAIIYLAFKSRTMKLDFYHFALFSLSIYLFFSTTVHPWYLCLGVILSLFTNIRYIIMWSFLIVLSYAKYTGSEMLYYYMISIEYFILAIYLVWEFNYKTNATSLLDNKEG